MKVFYEEVNGFRHLLSGDALLFLDKQLKAIEKKNQEKQEKASLNAELAVKIRAVLEENADGLYAKDIAAALGITSQKVSTLLRDQPWVVQEGAKSPVIWKFVPAPMA